MTCIQSLQCMLRTNSLMFFGDRTRHYVCIYSTRQIQGIRLVQIAHDCTQIQTHLYTEANTCLYKVQLVKQGDKHVYTRRQMRLPIPCIWQVLYIWAYVLKMGGARRTPFTFCHTNNLEELALALHYVVNTKMLYNSIISRVYSRLLSNIHTL